MAEPAQQPQRSWLAAGVQGELIKLEDLPDDTYVEDESDTDKDGKARLPEYTAARFFRKRPEDYQLCVAFLAAGYGLLKIARLLKVHHMTVAAVRDSEPAAIDIEKEKIRKNLRLAIGISSERLPEIMATLPGGQVPLATAILIDQLAKLDGEPTQRVEITVKGHLTHDAVARELMSFPEAIDVQASPMVSGAEVCGQKDASGAASTSSEMPSEPAPSTDQDEPTSPAK